MKHNKRKYGNRSVAAHIRVTPATYTYLMIRADLSGRTMSDYCNQLFERHIERLELRKKKK